MAGCETTDAAAHHLEVRFACLCPMLRNLPAARAVLVLCGSLAAAMPTRLPADPPGLAVRCGQVIHNPLGGDKKSRNMWSQYLQDYTVWAHHYRHQPRRQLFYVDIGANEPQSLSNTYFFDRCLGWRGICVEPQRTYHAKLLEMRTCELIPTCVSDRKRTVEFLNAANLGGVSVTNDNLQQSLRRRRHNSTRELTSAGDRTTEARMRSAGSEEMTCVPVSTMLGRRGTTHVDLMSIDVEGHELEVLRGIDWNATTVDVIVVERNSRWKEANRFLGARGFHRSPKNHEVYIHKRVRWGQSPSLLGRVFGS